MDERRLTELFTDAADSAGRNAPPATFDHADVLAGSRRARERSHRRMTGGVAVAAVVVAAAGLFSAGLLSAPSGASSSTLARQSAAPAPAQAQPYAAQPNAPQPYAGQQRQATPFGAQKRVTPGNCAEPDAQLFTQLTTVLPELKGATPRPLSEQVSCPRGGRGVEVDVDDDGARGVLRVLFSPSGGGMSVHSSGGGSVITSSSSARDGGSVAVSVVSDSGPAPYGTRVNQLAHALANQN